MSASCEPLGDFLSLSWTSCLISLFSLPKAVIRQKLSLLLHSQNSPLTDLFSRGAGTPGHPPAQKGGASQAPKPCLKLPLGRRCSGPSSLLVHRSLLPILVWKLLLLSSPWTRYSAKIQVKNMPLSMCSVNLSQNSHLGQKTFQYFGSNVDDLTGGIATNQSHLLKTEDLEIS